MRPPVVNSLIAAIERISKPLLRDFGELSYGHISRQAAPGFCTTAVHRAEQKLQEEILRLFPASQFWLSSQDHRTPSAHGHDVNKPLWIIQALDGLGNFVRGLPHWAVSICLYEHPHMTTSVVYDPLRYELFWAYRGAGSFLNQKRLRYASSPHAWTHPLLATESFGKRSQSQPFTTLQTSLLAMGGGTQQWGSPSLALAYTATDRYDGFVGLNFAPHHLLAGLLLVKEAGGMISHLPPLFSSSSPSSSSSSASPSSRHTLFLASSKGAWSPLTALTSSWVDATAASTQSQGEA